MLYLLRRFVLLIVTVIFVSFITFGVFQILPGDPVLTMLGTEADPAQIENLRSELGLDLPLYVQYFDWITGLFTGDLGNSIRFSMPVMDLMLDRLPVTLSLAAITLFIVCAVSLPLGMFAARRQNKLSDLTLSTATQIGMAIPSFWLGMMLIIYVAMNVDFSELVATYLGPQVLQGHLVHCYYRR